jgi:hypothetical protein
MYGSYGQGEQDVYDSSTAMAPSSRKGNTSYDMFWSGYFITKKRAEKSIMAHPFKVLI